MKEFYLEIMIETRQSAVVVVPMISKSTVFGHVYINTCVITLPDPN